MKYEAKSSDGRPDSKAALAYWVNIN